MSEPPRDDLWSHGADLYPSDRIALPGERPLSIWVSDRPNGAWVTLVGELDLNTVGALDLCLREVQTRSRRVTLDLRALALIDSSGLSALFAARLRAARDRHVLEVISAPGQVKRMLSVAQWDRWIETISSSLPVSPGVSP